jgi:hypothetical protein
MALLAVFINSLALGTCSSFLFASNGIPIFIDAGTKMYSNSAADLELKKTKMHNTLSINNEDQAKLWGFFRWAYLPKKINANIADSEEELRLTNKFEGFYSKGKYTHNRKILVSKISDQITIVDEIHAKGKNNIYLNFILSPEIMCELKDSWFILRSNDLAWEITTTEESRKRINKINVYPNYDVPVDSFGLEIEFNSVNFPFQNTTIIKRV